MFDTTRFESALEAWNKTLAIFRDRVRGVAARQYNGLYICGRAGTGKTFGVRASLEAVGVTPEYHLGHVTPMGFFEMLQEHCDRVIVLDDVGALFDSKIGLQMLLAALGSQSNGHRERVVKYKRQGLDERVVFSGGIIAISNLELRPGPVTAALSSRVHTINYDPTEDQIAGVMLDIAKHGSPGMTADECRKVAEFLISESLRLKIRLDIRMMVDKAFPDYLHHRSGATEAHWRDLVRSSLEQRLTELKHATSKPAKPRRADQMRDEAEIAKSILETLGDPKQRVAEWIAQTGKSQAAFYRRLQGAATEGD